MADSFIGQQLDSVREAMASILKEEEEEEEEEEDASRPKEEEDNCHNSELTMHQQQQHESGKSMRMRKVSAALEAVVTDGGGLRADLMAGRR